jgi:tryptophanyl-tRNA synthetase
MSDKKIIFSGIKPSGRLNIGGYIGALSQWVEMQDKYNCIFCVVDYHAITVKQNPDELRLRTMELIKTYIAAGINPKNCILFKQSDVPAHTELGWVLNCCGARIADLNKMTQFKDKAGAHKESATVGLYDYPVLMAADILLYNTEIVPVGEDQRQHVELARDIARRFNKDYSEIFKIPEAVVRKEGARIMSLQDPTKKMSKSDESGLGCIDLLDDIETVKKKIMRAMTDSGSEVKYDVKNKPAVANLLTIYSYLSGQTVKNIEKEYVGKGYGDFKKGLAEVVAKFLKEFQDKYYALSDGQVLDILEEGRKNADKIASETLEKVRRAVGVR